MPKPAHFFLVKGKGSHYENKVFKFIEDFLGAEGAGSHGLQPFHMNLLISFWQLSEMQAMINSILPMRKLRNKRTNWASSQN